MLTEAQKNLIQTTYRKFTSREGFRPRYGQRVMIAEIAKYLGSIEENDQGERTSAPAVCVVEAGTGTGKTLAYCMSVLPLALDEKRKVIVSTATTALQEQVMSKDLPELAKGKGNKMISIPSARVQTGDEWMVCVAIFNEADYLIIHSGKRHLKLRFNDLEHYVGERGRRGHKLPRGLQKVDRLEVKPISETKVSDVKQSQAKQQEGQQVAPSSIDEKQNNGDVLE